MTKTKQTKMDKAFAAEVERRSGENVFLCYQCRKCASGCPLRSFMDGSPTEFMRQVQMGLKDEAMSGSTIWRCTACQTCSTRCPQGIDIAHVIDTVKIMAQEERRSVDTKNVRAFNWLWMTMLRHFGRIYEVGLVGGLNVAMKKPLQGIGLAVRMVQKGKLRFIPSIRRSAEVRKMFAKAKNPDGK